MATKKEKRQRNQEKHQRFVEECRLSGLEAQRKDVAQRQSKELEEWRENHTKNHNAPSKRIGPCPHCRIEMAAEKHAERLAKRAQKTA